MKLLNFGSLNYDYVYSVDHIVTPGETAPSFGMETFCGGKGLNQSVALAKAGAEVWHAGMVGEDGGQLLAMCRENGVDVSLVKTVPGKSGHTVIQVESSGQNCILLYGGSNRQITEEYRQAVFAHFAPGDMLLLQNEVNDVARLIELGYEKGMRVVLNPSPFDAAMEACDFSKIAILLVNEIEGRQITGQTEPQTILDTLYQRYPDTAVVLTLGKQGVIYHDKTQTAAHGIYDVPVVDTTAAGDTFTGYFLAALLRGQPVEEALELASKASSIAVGRRGAAPSIPLLQEVQSCNLRLP